MSQRVASCIYTTDRHNDGGIPRLPPCPPKARSIAPPKHARSPAIEPRSLDETRHPERGDAERQDGRVPGARARPRPTVRAGTLRGGRFRGGTSRDVSLPLARRRLGDSVRRSPWQWTADALFMTSYLTCRDAVSGGQPAGGPSQ